MSNKFTVAARVMPREAAKKPVVNADTSAPKSFLGGLGSWMSERFRGVREFWFTPADPIVLGFIRICTGFVLFYILFASGPLLSSFYGPDAWVDHATGRMQYRQMPWIPPRTDWVLPSDDPMPERSHLHMRNHPDAREMNENYRYAPEMTNDLGQPFFSPYYHLTSYGQMLFVHGIALFIAVLFTLGVGTRVTSVLAWIAGLSYIHRVPSALFGMDTMLGILLLYLMIGPSGAALSVDRLIGRWWRGRQGLPPVEPEPSVSANVVLRLLQIHFCIMYFIAGASKMQGPAWWNGNAIWQTLTNYEFTPATTELFTRALQAITINRWVWELICTSGAWSTLVLEISLPFLIWYRRWRWVMIVGSVGLHTFIGLIMGLTAFSLLMICILFAFLPPETLHWASAKLLRLFGQVQVKSAMSREETREPVVA